MCDNTNQHSLTRPFDLHLVYMYLHDLQSNSTVPCSDSFCIMALFILIVSNLYSISSVPHSCPNATMYCVMWMEIFSTNQHASNP